MVVMLDTSAVIAWVERKHLGVRAAVVESGAIPSLSVITLGELHHGAESAPDERRRRQRQATVEACRLMDVRPVSEPVARRYGQLSADLPRRVGAADRWIAATAAVHGHLLLTFDRELADDLLKITQVDEPMPTRVLRLEG